MATKSGIYTITNLLDGKIYVGHTINLYKRKYDHFKLLSKNKHPNILLQNSFNKHGRGYFVYEVLEECDLKFLVSQEHYWATILNTHNRNFGYNLRPTNPYDLHAKGYRFKLSKDVIEWRKANYKLDDNRQRVNKENANKAAKSRIGTKHAKESTIKMSQSRHKKAVVIEIYNTLGNKVGTVYTQRQASDLTGVGRSAISMNLSNKSKTTKNFTFKYKLI